MEATAKIALKSSTFDMDITSLSAFVEPKQGDHREVLLTTEKE